MFDVEKKLGFGCMRLPMCGDEIDTAQFCEMVDLFLENGFNYFDTAHGYHSGKSETALRECLTSRYPRERYLLTNKLSNGFFETQADIRPFFESQLRACGVDYFDFYLMHAQERSNFEKYKRCRAYETALELKAEGKIRHFGISFHDTADMLRQILTEYPQIEVVQLQFNYLDFDDPAVQSRKCYEVCREFGKPVLVMEPVKGGSLANPPQAARTILDNLRTDSPAALAIRFAAGFEGIPCVLSGMSTPEMVRENTAVMRDFRPLSDAERAAVDAAAEAFLQQEQIPCTACRYCTDGCPKGIDIPSVFACVNAHTLHRDWNAGYYYEIHTASGGKASDCIGCGKCEQICPQHLPIRKLLQKAAKLFE